jgi:hypothetical protein
MTTAMPHHESPANWRTDPDLRQVDVVVCTTAGIFVGHTYRTSRLRLLDALNKGFPARGMRIGTDYIPMTEVEMYLPEGGRQDMASVHIRKANVVFVAEKGGGQPDGEAGRVGKVIVAKKPVSAKVWTLPYVLAGRLHSAAWAELVTSLNQEDRFIPLTKVRLTPPLLTGEEQFDFVAVNKDQVIYVGEPAG